MEAFVDALLETNIDYVVHCANTQQHILLLGDEAEEDTEEDNRLMDLLVGNCLIGLDEGCTQLYSESLTAEQGKRNHRLRVFSELAGSDHQLGPSRSPNVGRRLSDRATDRCCFKPVIVDAHRLT